MDPKEGVEGKVEFIWKVAGSVVPNEGVEGKED